LEGFLFREVFRLGGFASSVILASAQLRRAGAGRHASARSFGY